MTQKCFKTKNGKVCFESKGKRKGKRRRKGRGLSGDLPMGECKPVKGRPGVIFCHTGRGLTGYEFKKKR